MRRPFIRAGSVTMVAIAMLAAPLSTVGAAPPDDDSSTEAVERFVDLIEQAGLTIVDPACAESAEADASGDGTVTFMCYGLTPDGEPLIATYAPRISRPDYYRASFTPEELAVIEEETARTAALWGYS